MCVFEMRCQMLLFKLFKLFKFLHFQEVNNILEEASQQALQNLPRYVASARSSEVALYASGSNTYK